MNTTTTSALLLASLLTLTACEKDDEPDAPAEAPCAAGNYGYVTISNTSSNPYQIRVEDIIVDTVPGNSILQDLQLTQGNDRDLKATQLSGFVLFPTVVETSLNVIECSHYSWQIP